MLTKRQAEILTMMRDDDAELVYERGAGWIELERVARRTVFAFLRLAAVRATDGTVIGRFERYTINETGLALLAAWERQR